MSLNTSSSSIPLTAATVGALPFHSHIDVSSSSHPCAQCWGLNLSDSGLSLLLPGATWCLYRDQLVLRWSAEQTSPSFALSEDWTVPRGASAFHMLLSLTEFFKKLIILVWSMKLQHFITLERKSLFITQGESSLWTIFHFTKPQVTMCPWH